MTYAILTFVIIIGTVLRFIHVDRGLWVDEIITLLDFVRLPFLDILTSYQSNNNHVLFSALAHLSISLFGEHAWSLRLPSVVFGVLSIPVLYMLGRLISGKVEALLASALLTFSYQHIWFSQNARGYSILLFWTLLSTYLFLLGIRGHGLKTWLTYAAATALGMYTHLNMVFVFAGQIMVFLALIVKPSKQYAADRRDLVSPLIGFLVAGCLTFLFYLPMMEDLFRFYLGGAENVGTKVATPLWALHEAIRGLGKGVDISGIVVAGAGLAFVIGLLSYWRENRLVVALFVLPPVLALLAALLMNRPIFPRFFLFTLGFMLLILVKGAMTFGAGLEKRIAAAVHKDLGETLYPKVGVALLCMTLLVSIWSLKWLYAFPKQDFEGAMLYLEKHRSEGEPILVAGPAVVAYHRYYQKRWVPVTGVKDLESARRQGHPVWLVYTIPLYLEASNPEVMTLIRKDFRIVEVFRGTLGGGDVVVTRAEPL